MTLHLPCFLDIKGKFNQITVLSNHSGELKKEAMKEYLLTDH